MSAPLATDLLGLASLSLSLSLSALSAVPVRGHARAAPPRAQPRAPETSEVEIAHRLMVSDSIVSEAAPPIREIHCSSYNANAANEDTAAVDAAEGLFGIFDGHSGGAASQFCRDNLLAYVKAATSTSVQSGPTALQHAVDEAPAESAALEAAFLKADRDFLTSAVREGRIRDGLSGACAIVARIHNGRVTVANAGDCRAVIGTEGADPPHWRAVALSDDHSVSHPEEAARLRREHPDEPDVCGSPHDPRVKGMLQPTRGLGDGLYKSKEFMEALDRRVLAAYGAGGRSVWRPPYTTARPQVASRVLQPSDRFLVLGTDGLFMDLTNEQVVAAVAEWMRAVESAPSSSSSSPSPSSPRSDPAHSLSSSPALSASPLDLYSAPSRWPHGLSCSAYLVRRALLAAFRRGWGRMGWKLSDTEMLALLLEVPPGQRRNIHDDITVTVVFLDPHHAPAHARARSPSAASTSSASSADTDLYGPPEPHSPPSPTKSRL